MSDLTVRRFESSDTERIRELHEEAMRVEGAYDQNIPDTDMERVEEEYLSDGEFLVGLFGGKSSRWGGYDLFRSRWPNFTRRKPLR